MKNCVRHDEILHRRARGRAKMRKQMRFVHTCIVGNWIISIRITRRTHTKSRRRRRKNSQPESHITVCYISQHTQNETWQTVFLLFQSCRAASASTLIELHSSCFQICLRATERTIYNLIRFFFCFVFLSRWCDRETMLFGCDVNTTLNMNFNKSATTKYEVVYRTSKANEPEEKTSKKRTHKKRRRQNHQSS